MAKSDNTVQKTASLSEKAVQAVARGDVPPMTTRPRRSAPERDHPVYTGVVNQRVIEEAKRIIFSGTYTRWEALGPNEVLVI